MHLNVTLRLIGVKHAHSLPLDARIRAVRGPRQYLQLGSVRGPDILRPENRLALELPAPGGDRALTLGKVCHLSHLQFG